VDDESRARYVADAERFLAHAQRAGKRRDWGEARYGLERAMWSASSAHAIDLLDAILGEIADLIAANPPADRLPNLEWLRDVALDERRKRTDEPPTPGIHAVHERLRALLLLLAYRAANVTEGEQSLRAFASADSHGDIRIDLQQPFSVWGRPLRRGYERGYSAFAEVNATWLREARRQVELTLRSIAAELVMAGAQVRGLGKDAIPLIAFALVNRAIPVGGDAGKSPLSKERADNAVLAVADAVAELPASSRAAYTDLYRIAFVLGVAQCYGDQAQLASLSLDS
jgi:hypothetical protein